MRFIRFVLSFAVLQILGLTVIVEAETPSLAIGIGTVEKAEKTSLRIGIGKPKRMLDLKITGTSNIRILSPQKRADKTIVTQRTAGAEDLTPGQEVAVIYTVADGENVLLSAVVKPVEKEK